MTTPPPVVSTWKGMYKKNWQGILVSEAFSHPAKFSLSLIEKIYTHAEEEGWLQPNAVILDPFGGVACGAWPAVSRQRGYHHVGVELEQHFLDLGQGCDCTGISKADWVRFYGRWDRMRYAEGRYWCPRCLMQAGQIQHMRRAFNERHMPKPQPPMFSDNSTAYWQDSGRIPSSEKHHYDGNIETWAKKGHRGATLVQGDSRQLREVLQEAGLCVSSPPYADGCAHTGGADPQPQHIQGGLLRYVQYGVETVLTSPPWMDQLVNHHSPDAYQILKDKIARDGKGHSGKVGASQGQHYGTTNGQLGNLPAGSVETVVQVDGCVSSPPFMASTHVNNHPNDMTAGRAVWANGTDSAARVKQDYADYQSQDNLATETPTTFWAAARQIVAETFALLRPGGHAIWVCKNYIRNGQIVPFSADWARLCESCGFELVHWHKAMLVETHGTQGSLFGADTTVETRRESFFRRLGRLKTGLSIDYESVLCMGKPLRTKAMASEAEESDLCVASPPYADSWHASDTTAISEERMRKAGYSDAYITREFRASHGPGGNMTAHAYGHHPAQLGAMKAGSVEACISSPPYAGTGEVLGKHNGIDWSKTTGTGQRLTPGRRMQPYGEADGQLGNMPEGPKP